MKYLILIGDGMGDHPLPELDGRTPLAAARTPVMDQLCRRGRLLAAATVPAGMPPGSDVANMSLLGYDPARYYTGRAPLEAASMGVELESDQTAFRCNLVTLEYQGHGQARMVDFSGGHISSPEASELIDALQQHCGNQRFTFHAGISYRHLLVVQDPIPDLVTVPPHDYIGQDVSDHYKGYLRTEGWQQLVSAARELLENHPVNRRRRDRGQRPVTGIWPWGEGKMPSVPPLSERFGITGTMISAVDLLKGLGVCAGLKVARVEGATGYIDTNYEGKAEAALTALETRDLAFVHLEGPDEAGHQGRLDHKIQAIEDFDARIVGSITAALRDRGEPFRALVTMDHFTPLSLQTHTAEPVPAILYDSRETETGSGLDFSESAISTPDQFEPIAGHSLIRLLLERCC